MTLGLTPTLGPVGAIIPILLHHVFFFFSSIFFFFLLLIPFLSVLSHPLSLTSRSATRKKRSRWRTTSVDNNCAFARCFGTGEQLLGDLMADVTEDVCNEPSIPWQLHGPAPSVSVSFILRLSFVPMTSFYHLSILFTDDLCPFISFTPTQRRWCAMEPCIDFLTEKPEHC